MKSKNSKLIVALDINNKEELMQFLTLVGDLIETVKIGPILFTKEGPEIVKYIKSKNYKVFLDLKFHDIPKTVGGAVSSATEIGIDMLTIHTLGGFNSMEAGIAAATYTASELKKPKPLVFGVTILTSYDEAHIKDIFGGDKTLSEHVVLLSRLAKSSGLDGVICSPLEIEIVKKNCGDDFLVVVPGIRLPDENIDDQRRVTTPKEAIEKGADFIVVGRSITASYDPVGKIEKIKDMIGE